MTRRDLLRQITGALAVAAAPILAGATLAQRLINPGLSMPTWRLVQRRMGAEMFSTYPQASSRATGYLGWFEDKMGRVVGWLRADGALLRWATRDGREVAPQASAARVGYEPLLPASRFLERIGTAMPMDDRNPVNW